MTGTTTIIRVNKTKNYTVVCNHHITNQALTLKAKGLMTLMLSLPDDWDYSINGLVSICREGPDAIKAALNELEAEGYLVRRRTRNDKGQVLGVEYTLYEMPISQQTEKEERTASEPKVENPLQVESEAEKPKVENPLQVENEVAEPKVDFPHEVFPWEDNPRQQSTNITNILNKQNNNLSSIYTDDMAREQVDYDQIVDVLDSPSDVQLLDSVIDVMVDAMNTDKPMYVNGFRQRAETVRRQLKKIDKKYMLFVIESLKNSATEVKNYRLYILTALCNAPTTYGAYNSLKNKRTMATPRTRRNSFHNFPQREDTNYDDCIIDISKY